ncbi:MAG: hypothetical protein M3619_27775 [Myxococcota bacterium]|nr:hypothetical protein [Myxococcota bacterium]
MRHAFAVLLVVLATRVATAQRQPGWEVRIPERVEVTLGDAGTLPIAIAVDRGLVISKDAAVIVDVVAAAGVTVKKARLGRTDAVDPEADAPRFAVPVRGAVAGEHVIKIRLRLWLCGMRSCRPLDIRRQTTIVVAASQPPAPAP